MRRAVLLAGVLLAGLAASGCAGSDPAPTATTEHPSTVAVPTVPPTTVAGDTTVDPTAEVLRFEGPTETDCTGASVDVTVTYATRHVTAVGFAVDGVAVAGPPAQTTGTYTVPIPCDERVHTVMLIGSGTDGPVFATKAMVTRPT